MIRLAISVLLLSVGLSASAQDCFDFHRKNCQPEKSKFSYSVNNASVSYAFLPGESKCVQLQMYQGKDYRITICSDSLYNGVVSFVLRDEEGKIFYDNSQDNYNANLEFSCRKSNTVEITLTAPNRLDVEENTKGCIGILIEDMVTPKIGF